jgi:type IV secretion system protein VirB2
MPKQTFNLPISSIAAFAFLFVLAAVLPGQAWASSTSSGGLPWETPLQTVASSLTGPVAYAISLIGVVVTGAMLIFGGEINEFARRIIMLVLVVALLVSATNLLSTLFSTGAVV